MPLVRKFSPIEELKTLASHLAAWADFPEEDVEEVTGQEMEEVLGQIPPPHPEWCLDKELQ